MYQKSWSCTNVERDCTKTFVVLYHLEAVLYHQFAFAIVPIAPIAKSLLSHCFSIAFVCPEQCVIKRWTLFPIAPESRNSAS